MGVDVKSERTLGLVGSILGLVGGFTGVIPYVGALSGSLSLVGAILILVALKGIGDKLGDERPFRYYLYSIVVAFVGVILALILVVIGVLSMANASIAWGEPLRHPMGYFGAGMLIFGFLAFVAVLIIGVYFAKQAWEAMYEITGVDAFQSTAKWLWWGALTAIILVGFILLLVASIYQIIGFANLPEELETTPMNTAS
ncbi:DUF996 domain-containing protein [Thermococcus indicus]|uniref:DUF996 domain-containing protein n=1 Tax=Thermococcus indicus TaxID=2586643 RepID=A0A4Y5SN89_9EURY|nr:DUF996 domain-containing protein [Thermococcus indicus]